VEVMPVHHISALEELRTLLHQGTEEGDDRGMDGLWMMIVIIQAALHPFNKTLLRHKIIKVRYLFVLLCGHYVSLVYMH